MSNLHLLVKRLVPPLLDKFHKGQLGRVLVVGGSEDYTGAPYFSSMASALVGADMSHILCSKLAGTVIKGYSPNLMVHPYLNEGPGSTFTKLDDKIIGLLDRIHVVVVGPGLGRDKLMIAQVTALIKEITRRKLPLVVDADGLFLLQNNLDLVKGADTILTPNVVEFGRLAKAAGIGEDLGEVQRAESLASQLGVTVVVKGANDIITNGHVTAVNDLQGSPRRVSGQGDTLSGSIATFLAWRKAYTDKLWDVEPIDYDLTVLAGFAGSCVTRLASRMAFNDNKRGMVTTDVTSHVASAFSELFEHDSVKL